jgi:hypothetical protein
MFLYLQGQFKLVVFPQPILFFVELFQVQLKLPLPLLMYLQQKNEDCQRALSQENGWDKKVRLIL